MTWTHLPRGNYNVYIRSTSQWTSTLLKTVNVPLGSTDQQVVY